MSEPKMRPLSRLDSLRLAFRAAVEHFIFARGTYNDDGIDQVVRSSRVTPDRLNDIGSRWSAWARMQGRTPTDPAVLWRDMADMFSAFHEAKRPDGATPAGTREGK